MADNEEVRLMAAHLRDEFRRNAVQLDGHTKSVNKARVAGGLLGFVGSGKLLASIFLLFSSFFTRSFFLFPSGVRHCEIRVCCFVGGVSVSVIECECVCVCV